MRTLWREGNVWMKLFRCFVLTSASESLCTTGRPYLNILKNTFAVHIMNSAHFPMPDPAPRVNRATLLDASRPRRDEVGELVFCNCRVQWGYEIWYTFLVELMRGNLRVQHGNYHAVITGGVSLSFFIFYWRCVILEPIESRETGGVLRVTFAVR